jgi:phospholipid/cholesterol/gamma-HCH transport system ATP-binding protein
MDPKPMIEYRDVWKSFDEPVLQGVSLVVEEKEILSLVGPSGTGKSVLLKTTLGLILPDGGDVTVDGESVFAGGEAELESIRRKVGYVFQNAALFDSLSVYDNVAQGLRETELARLSPEELGERVAEALKEVNLDPGAVADRLPAELSGGMRKRVGIARAIIGDTRILLYDEPMTGLDPINAASVARLVAEIRERRGVTSVVVTHDIEGALAMSDRIALLEGGQVRFVGAPSAFRSSRDPLVQAFADRGAAAQAAERLALEAATGGGR